MRNIAKAYQIGQNFSKTCTKSRLCLYFTKRIFTIKKINNVAKHNFTKAAQCHRKLAQVVKISTDSNIFHTSVDEKELI